MSDLKTFRKIGYIDNGVAIDHIKKGKAQDIVRILGLDNLADFVVIASNLKSNKCDKKDLIKIESKKLDISELNKIALLSKDATINIIKDGVVTKKWKVNLPDYLEAILKCNNPNCITNHESITTKFKVINKDDVMVKCNYCEKLQKRLEF